MSVREMAYEISTFTAETAQSDRPAGLAFFLLDNVGSVCGRWVGRMKATDQRALFGRYIGKGRIWVDGADETVEMSVSMCFGTMRDVVGSYRWQALQLSVEG